MKLLVVDDMPEVHGIINLNLSYKYEICHAQTEEKALKMIEEEVYDFVISDYHLSYKSPKGGLKIIRAAVEKGLPATLMSKENHRGEASKEGAGFIFKKNLIDYLRKKERKNGR